MTLRAKQILAVALGVVVAAVMVVLGLWQMSRFQLSVIDIAAQRAAEPPVALAPAVHEDGSIDDVYGRRVTASGTYLPDYEEVVGTTKPRVVTLMRLDDGRHLAVVRGTVAPGVEPPAPPTGRQDILGVFLASDNVEHHADGESPGGAVRVQTLAQTWPSPLVAGYVTLDASLAGEQGLAPAEAALPEQKGTSMHQGYALQWWVFAAASIAFGIFTARQLRVSDEQRRARLAERRRALAEAGNEVVVGQADDTARP